jgi:hypothetical protein
MADVTHLLLAKAIELDGSRSAPPRQQGAAIRQPHVLAMAEYDGPAYLRAIRADLPIPAALATPVTVQNLGVRRIPKSGRTPTDVLDYVGLSVTEIAAAAERLARRDGASPQRGVAEKTIASR